jgi:hypothetical protein
LNEAAFKEKVTYIYEHMKKVTEREVWILRSSIQIVFCAFFPFRIVQINLQYVREGKRKEKKRREELAGAEKRKKKRNKTNYLHRHYRNIWQILTGVDIDCSACILVLLSTFSLHYLQKKG